MNIIWTLGLLYEYNTTLCHKQTSTMQNDHREKRQSHGALIIDKIIKAVWQWKDCLFKKNYAVIRYPHPQTSLDTNKN